MSGRCGEVHPSGAVCGEPAGHYPKTAHRPKNEHHCHARGCMVPCKPETLMCLRHWRMVPRELQRAVWATYRQGQCDDMRPSRSWHDAADAAIEAVYRMEQESAAAKAKPQGAQQKLPGV